MTAKLYIDLESFNEWPIKSGVYRYAEHESCEIMLVSYALDDGPEQVWDVTSKAPMPRDLRLALEDPAVGVVMHNSAFDRTVLRETGMFELPPSRIIDTMVQAYCHGLPGGLDKLCKLFNLPEEQAKMKEGRALVLFFCKPNAGKRNTRLTHPEKWAKFMEYAKRDITSMRQLHGMMPSWNYPGRNFPEAPSSEHRLWCIDQRINDRGFAVDLELAAGAVETSRFERAYLNQRTSDITSGDVKAATQRDKLLAHVLAEYGVTLPDTKADTLQRRIDDENLPLELRQLLDLRVQSSRNTATKYKTVLDAANEDGRVRGCIQFCGAPVTGRFSGKIVQPQNFMRPTMKQEAIDEAIRLIKLGSAELVYDNMPEVLGNCIRGVIVAPPGRMLFAADLKSIEGRGLAWLAGEQDAVQFYHDFDAGAVNYDSYMLAYADSFGGSPSDVTKLQRQIGKVIELACLGADTKVITNNGVKRIVEVTVQDKLWDGEQWVQHRGLVTHGVKPTVEINGVSVTQEHLFLAGHQWHEASQLASNASTLSLALATGSESLRSLASSMATPEVSASFLSVVLAAQNRTPSMTTICATEKAPAATHVLTQKQSGTRKAGGVTPTSFLTTSIAVACSTAWLRLARDAKTLAPGNTRLTAAGVFASVKTGWMALTASAKRWLTCSRFLDGTTPSLSLTASTTTKGTNLATFVSYLERSTAATNARFKSCSAASQNLKPVYDIAHAGPRNRFTILSDSGAFVVHNCGYGGGVGAFLTFAMTYHLDLDIVAEYIWSTGDQHHLKECADKWTWAKTNGYSAGLSQRKYAAFEYVKQKWRAARPRTVAFWDELANGFRMAALYPDTTFFAGPIKFYRQKQWLRMRLPSGRNLNFLQPAVEGTQLSFMGSDRYSRKWTRLNTHGGKLSGLATQAFASDILRDCLVPIENDGFDIVLTVHDEVVAEGDPSRSVDEMARHMITPKPYAKGLPLAVDGFAATSYRKN